MLAIFSGISSIQVIGPFIYYMICFVWVLAVFILVLGLTLWVWSFHFLLSFLPSFHPSFLSSFSLSSGSPIAQADLADNLEFLISLLVPPECWDYRNVTHLSGLCGTGGWNKVLCMLNNHSTNWALSPVLICIICYRCWIIIPSLTCNW